MKKLILLLLLTIPAVSRAQGISVSIVSRTINGTKATVTATYTDSNIGAQTAYQLWADASANKLLTSGRNLNNTGAAYTITWTGNKVGTDMPNLTVTDSTGATASTNHPLSSSSLTGGLPSQNFPYNAALFSNSGASLTGLMSIRGGTGQYTWRVSSGSLPAGVTLSNGALVFSSAPSSWSFTLTVADSAGATLSYSCSSTPTSYAPQGTISWIGN